MKRIKLTQGKYTLVSDKDYAYLNQWEWCCSAAEYAIRGVRLVNKPTKHIYMHRVILERMGLKNFKHGDHRNCNRLDNRRINLRVATCSENQHNKKLQKNNTSGYKGVSWYACYGKWRVRIWAGRKSKHLGYFIDIIIAAKAYNKAAKKYHGKFAKLNPI